MHSKSVFNDRCQHKHGYHLSLSLECQIMFGYFWHCEVEHGSVREEIQQDSRQLVCACSLSPSDGRRYGHAALNLYSQRPSFNTISVGWENHFCNLSSSLTAKSIIKENVNGKLLESRKCLAQSWN